MRVYFAIFCLLAASCGGSGGSGRKSDTSGGGSGFVIDQDGSSTGSDGADGTDGADGAGWNNQHDCGCIHNGWRRSQSQRVQYEY